MKVFISYAREDRDFVRKLHEALTSRGRDSWVDWEDIPLTAKWLAEIYAGIESADTFVFVISPESAVSETCRLEIAHAVAHSKRLVPVVRRDVDSRAVPDAVSALNWVFFRETDNFDAGVQLLMKALDTDLEWVHAHTRLLVRAIDWETRSRDAGLLLRGSELRDAERALASASVSRPPLPTALQVQFVLLSRKAANRRQRSMIVTLVLGAAGASVLAYLAWSFSQQRDVQRNIASANALAAQAQLARDRGANMLPVSLLLALESERIAPSTEAEQLIRQTLPSLPRQVGRMIHEQGVTAVAFSPDTRLLATAAEEDATVRIWEVATQREVEALRHSGTLAKWISAVAFTPDGSTVFTGGLEGITAWDVVTGKQIRRLASGVSVQALAISSDGTYLAIGDHEGGVVVQDVATDRQVMQGRHDIIVNALAWSPDSQYLASGSSDKTARVWQVPGGQMVSLPHGNAVSGVSWSPDGRWIATGDWSGVARVWERTTGREHTRFDTKSPIEAVAFSTDGTHLIAATQDHTARMWDLTSGTESARITHGAEVQALAVSSDGRYLATGSKDRTAAVWDIGGGDQVTRLVHAENIVTVVAYSPDGTRLATVCDRTVRLWELPGGRELARLDHDGVVRAVAFTGDGRSLVAAADGARSDLLSASVTSWDTASGRRQQQLAVRQSVTGFSLDGRYFATADFKEGTLVRETASGNQVIRISQDVVERFASAVALSPDHHYLAAALNEGLKNYRTYVWELPSRAQRCTFEYGSDVRALAFSSDGRWLAAGGEDNTARVWALDGCRETARISLADEIGAVAFSPDGKFLATGSRDRTARVWALPEATELARLTFGGVVSGVTFSPDGRYVAAASSDRTARVWQWRSDEDLTTEVCARVGRSLTREEWREYLGQEPYRETCAGLTAPRAGTPPANGVAIAGRTPSTRPVPLELESGSHEPTRPSRASAPAAHAPELVVKQDQSSPVNDVAFSPDGTRLAVADWNGVGFWDLTIGCLDARILGRTENESGVRVEAIAFSPDGKLLAGHGSGRGAWLFDLQARTIKRRLETEDEIKSLAFSPDGKLPAAGDDHNAITLWDVASGAQVRQMKEHEGTVTSLAFSPDGKLLVSGGGDDTTRFWDVAGGNQLRRVKGGTNYATVNAVAFSPDGRSVANGALQLLDTTSGTVQDTLDDISGPLDRLVFSPGGELLAGASLSNIPLWDGRTGRLLRKLKAQENLITSIAFSPDGRFLASGAGWQHTVLWDMAKSEPIAKLIAIGAADWLVTSPDGHFDASPGAMTQIRYYKEGQPVALESLTTTLVKRRLLPEILAGTNPRS